MHENIDHICFWNENRFIWAFYSPNYKTQIAHQNSTQSIVATHHHIFDRQSVPSPLKSVSTDGHDQSLLFLVGARR